MTASLVARPGRWALPPQPPETWVGSTATLVLLVAAALALGTPGLVVLPAAGPATVVLGVLYGVGALFAVASTYLLVVQASVTQDSRLSWAAGGFGGLLIIELVRCLDPAIPGRAASGPHLRMAAALSLAWLVSVPVVTLTATLRRYGVWLLAFPALVTAGVGLAAYELPLVETKGSVTVMGPLLAVAAGLLGAGSALWWRRHIPDGNRGPWGWVGATLLLIPAIALLRAYDFGQHDRVSWASLVVEDIVLLVPALGLYAISARGYLKQSRRWHQLESEVRALRVSSALLPGLSITPEDDAGLPERSDVVDLISTGLMEVALQPVLDLASGSPVGQEALARFGGRIPTDRWFRAAGLYGLGIELERMTLAAALGKLAVLPDGQFLAINIAPASLHDREVLALLDSVELSRVIIEVTEHDAVNDYGVTREALGLLRARGARIAVDDVGAGFASLRHVLLLQPDVVKLDTSLTRDVHLSPRQIAIVRALVTFSDEVGATVLAEGIEIAEQVPALLQAGVTLGQGWHLGIPVITS